MKVILVTGGCGFIGSNFIRHLLGRYEYRIINLDALTYAGNPDNVRDLEGDRRYRFVAGDISDADTVRPLLREVNSVVNFAAETHVDRSLGNGRVFVETDVCGTYALLEEARQSNIERFLHVSTDEVYGDIPPGLSSRETDALRPRSPYAASKAGGEMMCFALHATYGLPVVIGRASNNIGPYQHLEKAVPLFVTRALEDEAIPLYGDGGNIRDWQFVRDHCEALDLLLHRGEPGEAYNIGAGNERTNIDVLNAILAILGKPMSLVRRVQDRAGHDGRYSLDTGKLRSLGWRPEYGFEAAIEATVRWYRDNRWWWEKAKAGPYRDYFERQYARRLAASTPLQGGE